MLVAASWLGAAVLTGTIAWRAVAVLDADTPRTGVLSTQQVHEKLASAQAAAQATTPSQASERVNWKTRYPCARFCIQLPEIEMS